MDEKFVQGCYVTIEKLSAIEAARYPTAQNREEHSDKSVDRSPYVGYNAEGYLDFDVKVGRAIFMSLTAKNGKANSSNMHTSRVIDVEINGNVCIAKTMNSIYQIRAIPKAA